MESRFKSNKAYNLAIPFVVLLFLSIQTSSSRFSSKQYDVLLFDAYGTLLDVDILIQSAANTTSDSASLVNLWRRKQLEYTWQRSLLGRYTNFWKITKNALEYSLKQLNITISSSEKRRLVNCWLYLPTFSDVKSTLPTLAQNYKLAVLSNGTPRMLELVFQNAGLREIISPLISVNDIKIYKPHPSVYHYGNKVLRRPASRILYVSSNCWDAIGARSYGFPSVWINRRNDPLDILGSVPKYIFSDLNQLSDYLE